MRSLIASYIAGGLEETVSRTFQGHRAVTLWFRSVDARVLRSLMTGGTRTSRSHWVKAWRWMASAPDALYAREAPVLRDLVDVLLGSRAGDWSDEVSDAWLQILRRSRSEAGTPRTRIALCVQALGYSFEHKGLSLGAVAAEAFYDVYAAVTGWSMFAGETGRLFSVFDWDKGKQLRRALVDSFLNSRWPADELVLAAGDVHLLRKVFKRLTRRRNGVQYAREALALLERRRDLKARELAGSLRTCWRIRNLMNHGIEVGATSVLRLERERDLHRAYVWLGGCLLTLASGPKRSSRGVGAESRGRGPARSRRRR